MNILDIIDKKEQNEKLTKDEINFIIQGFLDGTIKDYQMSALLTEIDLLGLSDEETIELTNAMLHSGEVLDFGNEAVDKHSTGGVGDKTTIVLAPLVASLGVKVAKMSGRGLGHTGGTIDKLESISGFKTQMTLKELQKQVNEIGVAVVGQMANLVPADKKIYALRDVTGTVDSIPLIASSIMSKKLASGAHNIVIDLKVGNGALVANLQEAETLAKLMVKIGNINDKHTICVITDMDEPLGNAIGNALEILESIETLKGNGPKDLEELVITLGALMVSLNKNISIEEATSQVKTNLQNGKAYEKFLTWIKYQNGDINNIEISKQKREVLSTKEGYISHVDALKLGKLARNLGAGRLTEEDQINPRVGLIVKKKVGDYVKTNEPLVQIYYEDKNITDEEILNCFEFSSNEVIKPDLIKKIIK